MSQLALPLRLADHARFNSFLATGNEQVVAFLQDLAKGTVQSGCWIWGASASGKTHLLQAVCAAAGDRSVYVALADPATQDVAILDDLASRSLVCVDDLQRVAGNASWERSLFNLYNDLQAHGGQLIVAAAMSARECAFDLPDLASRMSQLPSFYLSELAEQDRAAALTLRAAHRGLELPAETARYLLARSRRDMASLYRLLDTLDRAALQAQRRLTVPFVREVLQQQSVGQ